MQNFFSRHLANDLVSSNLKSDKNAIQQMNHVDISPRRYNIAFHYSTGTATDFANPGFSEGTKASLYHFSLTHYQRQKRKEMKDIA